MINATDELLARDAIAAIKAEARKTGIPAHLIHRHGSKDPEARRARSRVVRFLCESYPLWMVARAMGVSVHSCRYLRDGKTTTPKHLRASKA